MHLLYSAGLAAALLLTLPYWLVRMITGEKYRAGLAERLGRVPNRVRRPNPSPGCIWIHAVSVGEVLAVSGLIAALRRQFPTRRVVVSTTTAAGQKLARERFGEADVFYFPLDFAFALQPYFRALQPELVVLAETEFWPNFLRLARQAGARIAIVNARISDRSLPRYLKLRALWRRILAGVAVFLAQSEQDQRRLVAIGAPADRVRVAGNLKFDVKAPAELPIVGVLRQGLQRAGATHVVVCGSTVEGEEPLLLGAFQSILEKHSRAVLVLAPRHPERFAAVGALLASSGLKFWQRSRLAGEGPIAGGVLLLDTIGELAAVYALASLAFVGGSLVPRGGHNILEPAQHGVPILVGPHTENFRDIVGIFLRADAVNVVRRQNLAAEVLRLLQDRAARETLGRRAAEVFHSQSGATQRTLEALQPLLAETLARETAPGMVETAK